MLINILKTLRVHFEFYRLLRVHGLWGVSSQHLCFYIWDVLCCVGNAVCLKLIFQYAQCTLTFFLANLVWEALRVLLGPCWTVCTSYLFRSCWTIIHCSTGKDVVKNNKLCKLVTEVQLRLCVLALFGGRSCNFNRTLLVFILIHAFLVNQKFELPAKMEA